MGFVPATITITLRPGFGLPDTVSAVVPVTTNLSFQEHTDCPGACPEDTVIETPFELEGTFTQPGVSVVGLGGLLTIGILAKAIFRTTLTVTRPIIVDEHGNFCDVNTNRCDDDLPPTFTLPSTPNGNG
jgi:hypothetical protein